MKKISSYFWGFAAIAMMAACSNEELVPEAGDVTLPGIANGEAYLTVRLQDASALTRATDGGYKNGVASEHEVNDAQFFFFDKDGVFVGKASVWNGGEDNGEHGSTGNNVEFKGNTVLVLRGVTETSYPEYLLTVLNARDFQPETTLKATSEALRQWSNTYDDKKYFVMSTSSYFNNNEAHDKFYYATKVESSNFQDEPYEDATMNSGKILQVYVERLAAKVQVTTGPDLQPNEKGLYKIKNVSIAGDPNNEGGQNEGDMDVYVKFSNWGLSGTAKDSYLSKQLNDGWKTKDPFANWMNATDFRCFWAKSTVYGTDPDLSYTSYSELSSTINGTYDPKNYGYAYCNENTNVAENISDNNVVDPAKVTSVLIGAQVCDAEGNALDLVRHNGLLFKKDAYLNYVVNVVNNANPFNAYTSYVDETDNETKYKKLDGSYLKLVRDADSKALTVVVDEQQFDGEKEFYSITEVDGKKVATELSADDAKKALQGCLDAYTTDETLFVCDEAFTNGKMYYAIPIEHLAGFGTEGENTKVIIEGSYGVVRNHWYQIVLDKLENLGTGVFDETEVIIPTTPEQKYYLAATINILSWKIVNQSVEL
ncbi:Mfa1 family fimbria major subunit [Bacteroides acidifaciens]|jgi:hypothetical protein|uniref:Mfa1 family fimbria major subunit n=1 Tax=Bacteroides acidifaciens TaxID=85831 RepID=UPI0025707652|nr:Mfa1 family fimbria major subunit [Bacteroides acidifaciens]